MKISQQRRAFFAYSNELASYCIENLDSPYNPTILNSPSCIILYLDSTYAFATLANANARGMRRQREYLPESEFYNILLLPDAVVKSAYITSLYQEAEDKLNSSE